MIIVSTRGRGISWKYLTLSCKLWEKSISTVSSNPIYQKEAIFRCLLKIAASLEVEGDLGVRFMSNQLNELDLTCPQSSSCGATCAAHCVTWRRLGKSQGSDGMLTSMTSHTKSRSSRINSFTFSAINHLSGSQKTKDHFIRWVHNVTLVCCNW